MYVENLCEHCERGPFICNTKNCELDRKVPQITSTNITTSEHIVYEPAKTTHFEHFMHLI